jgi:hypothetical protein
MAERSRCSGPGRVWLVWRLSGAGEVLSCFSLAADLHAHANTCPGGWFGHTPEEWEEMSTSDGHCWEREAE